MLQKPKIKKRYSKTMKKELKGDLLLIKGVRRKAGRKSKKKK